MRSKFITDPLDPADGFSSTAGAEFSANFLPLAGHDGGNPLAMAPIEIFYTPFFSGPGVPAPSPTNPGNVVTITSGGITFNLTYDTAAMAASSSFRATIEQAASILSSTISDKITVNLNIDISGTGGGASAGPQYGFLESYSTIRADLKSNATPGDTAFDALPTGSTFEGQSNVAVWSSQLKLFGILSATNTAQDGTANFATDIPQNLLVGVALHELTHALGRVPYGPPSGPEPDIFDFFRFTSTGNHLISGTATAPPAYFSLDNGNTHLADFGQTSDSSDFLNSGVQGPNDPYNEFYTSNTLQSLTTVDKQLLDALGFHVFTTTVIEAFGWTKLVQVGNNYFLDSISSGTGPELTIGGAPVVAGQRGAWAPIGAEATATGYEVAWKAAGADQYTVWNTDSSGNFVSDTIGVVSGTSIALESLEPSFHQDLNGDGVIGIPTTTVIESFGSTSLVQVGIHYFLDSVSTGTGPELMFNGAPVVAGQRGAWAPIGAEATATGYEVAWKAAGADQYTVWNTDSSGNFVSDTIGVVSGTSIALDLLETSFHQDLNGDGVIGVPAAVGTVIESFGSTSLVEVGGNYFLDSNSSGTGPELMIGGAPVVAGQRGAWAPIGAEATATGYEVAWKAAGADQYTVWNTDSSGNFVSDTIGVVSGTSIALESLEPSFHQDLNGDGVIGILAAAGPSAPASQGTTVTVVNNDKFVFSPGIGADVVANAGSASTIELDGFSLVTSNAQLAALLPDAQAGQPQALFQSTNGGHDTLINLGNHDSITLTNVHIADPHASHFIIL